MKRRFFFYKRRILGKTTYNKVQLDSLIFILLVSKFTHKCHIDFHSYFVCLLSLSLSSYDQNDSEAVALVFQLKASNSIFTTFYHKIQEAF